MFVPVCGSLARMPREACLACGVLCSAGNQVAICIGCQRSALKQLRRTSFDASQLLQAGFAFTQLCEVGFDASRMRQTSFEYRPDAAGFDATELSFCRDM